MVGQRGLAGRLMNLQHRGIAPSWSRKSPQAHQGFRLKRFGLHSSLSAPAQSKNIAPHPPAEAIETSSGLHQSFSPRQETRQMSP